MPFLILADARIPLPVNPQVAVNTTAPGGNGIGLCERMTCNLPFDGNRLTQGTVSDGSHAGRGFR